MKHNQFIALVWTGCITAISAQPIPNAGGQLQQLPVTPKSTVIQPVPLQIKPVTSLPLGESGEISVLVKSIQLKGMSSYSEQALLDQTGFTGEGQLTLTQLRLMTDRIAEFYRLHGYFVAQVYLPPQKIQDGKVTIVIFEGHYGQVKLENSSLASDQSLSYFLQDIETGSPILSSALERRLLLLSDTPGVLVHSTLTPSTEYGHSDLLIQTTPGPRVNGSLDADNAGNRYTGTTRVGATLNINEISGMGDVASLRALSSGHGLQYWRGAYQAQLGSTTGGISYSELKYVLGREFVALDAHGSQKMTSLYASYPIVRSLQKNVYAGLSIDHKNFEDEVGATASFTSKHANVISASVRGDHSDAEGVTNYGLTISSGRIHLDDANALALDSTSAKSQGHFNKLSFVGNRTQKISENLSIYVNLNGQVSSKNLDVSEKMELGGMYGVRAYPEGESFADQGYVLTLEARYQLNQLSCNLPSQLQLIAFIDNGVVQFNHTPWMVGDNRRTLSGAGVGINWTQAQNFMLRAYYAEKLGHEPALSSPDTRGRFWVQGVKYF